MRKLVLGVAVAAAMWIPLSGRRSDTALAAADLAWDRGDYVAALTAYLQILDSPAADDAYDAIALQTGELFQTIELTTDGDAPKFSPDGRLISYETGALPRRTTRLVSASDPTTVLTELQGFHAAFSPDRTRLAYLKITPSPSLDAAAAAVDSGPPAQRTQRLNAFNSLVALESRLVVRDLATGRETEVDTGRLRKTGVAFTRDDIVLAATAPDAAAPQLYAVAPDAAPARLTTGDGDKIIGEVSRDGAAVIFTTRTGRGRGAAPTEEPANPPSTDETPRDEPARGGGRGRAPQRFGLITFPDGKVTTVNGSAPTISADSTSLAYVVRDGNEYRLMTAPVTDAQNATIVRKGPERLDAPAFSPDASRLAFQMMPKEDWEIYTIGRDGKGEARLTREIQHDLLPRFAGNDRLIAMIGEARHRRSNAYDLRTGRRIRLFHNNSVRTIAPEYAWIPSPDGRQLLVVAERDGDTVSPERGVYIVELTKKITKETLRARLRTSLAAEQALRVNAERTFAPIAADVRTVVAGASAARVFSYEKALFDFDSKHITQPGNKKAVQYLFDTYRSFGYQPELQEFEAVSRNQPPIKTANVLATLTGTVNPELVYVVSSHFDSVAIGPGADDDTSGTAALLETARLLAGHPQPATIVFASFTGEEAGLLGSREYVRRAVASRTRIVGALNNDMVGWANDHRLDNTIRYSNPGIRDVQHAAAMQFTNLITYDALYYKSTDAAAYYEAFGDIVGGIGSYPVLSNPHYHQSHDLLDTINHQLVTEVAKTTTATLMLLAASPSRLVDLRVMDQGNGSITVSWRPSPEKGITSYIVAYGPPSNPLAQQIEVPRPPARITKASPGTVISVKAVNARGLEGWDWARVTVR